MRKCRWSLHSYSDFDTHKKDKNSIIKENLLIKTRQTDLEIHNHQIIINIIMIIKCKITITFYHDPYLKCSFLYMLLVTCANL